MNKNAPVTRIYPASRSFIKKVFRGKVAKEAETNLFQPKPLKTHGQLLTSRGARAGGKKLRRRVVVVDLFTPWGTIVKLRKSGKIPLVRGYPDVVLIQKPEEAVAT